MMGNLLTGPNQASHALQCCKTCQECQLTRPPPCTLSRWPTLSFLRAFWSVPAHCSQPVPQPGCDDTHLLIHHPWNSTRPHHSSLTLIFQSHWQARLIKLLMVGVRCEGKGMSCISEIEIHMWGCTPYFKCKVSPTGLQFGGWGGVGWGGSCCSGWMRGWWTGELTARMKARHISQGRNPRQL